MRGCDGVRVVGAAPETMYEIASQLRITTSDGEYESGHVGAQ